MAKVQDRRQQPGLLKQHGEALKESAIRLEMHTATHAMNTEAGRILDERIIVEEIRIIQNRLTAIMVALMEGDK